MKIKTMLANFFGTRTNRRWQETVTCLFEEETTDVLIMVYVVEYQKKLFYDRLDNEFLIRGL
ncbi:hypothetical protein NG799_25750 [Laspinema sp. D1]|jgi:hypothetical protein|uniref:Uncharacterized protein n=1 Tax=Laspinema palackyanum D2a TaxID=2953684 RepID=A0ABT2N0Q6_9CYAN|nr:hypothetical protein [Laspinema sp. D2a]